MLLPSALSCDAPQPPAHSRPQAGLFVSPPASPSALSSQYSIDSIMNTCRSLQSLISITANSDRPALAPAPSLAQLPTPPLAHAPTPMKLRLRSRASPPDRVGIESPGARSKTARHASKRRRSAADVMGPSDHELDHGLDPEDTESELTMSEAPPLPEDGQQPAAPATPKRARIAPEHLPLGLERSDFHHVHLLEGGGGGGGDPGRSSQPGTAVQVEGDGAEWSAEDDRILVELVLEKLGLSKAEWQECARSLGKDRHSTSRRWRSLVTNGDVGLRARSSRRARLRPAWR